MKIHMNLVNENYFIPISTDRGHIVSASQAAYLLNSEASVCCLPSVLSFGSKEDAEKFRQGFSGEVVTLREALQCLRGMMRA